MQRRYTTEKSGLWWGKDRGLGSRHKTDQGRTFMFMGTRVLSIGILSRAAVGLAFVGAAALAPAQAQESVKIGLILPMTGGQASTGKQIDNAVKLYMQQKGDTVAGKKIEIILKDDGAVPDNTKRLAQELIVNDKVNFI